jgi:hypothetical protein
VLRKEARGVRIASEGSERVPVQTLSVGRDDEHPWLIPTNRDCDRATANSIPIMTGGVLLANEEVGHILTSTEPEADFEEEDIEEGEPENGSGDMYL